MQHEITCQSEGSTVPHLNMSDIRNLDIPVPPSLPEQRAIARILGALDDKIELNRRMNQTLEEMARAIFKSWFVDFDPVRAKMEGRAPVGMDAKTAALFPHGFEESELGKVPKGWKVGTLGDVANNPRRGVKPSEIPMNTPYIGLEHMPRRCISLSEWGEVGNVKSNKFQFTQGEILFGKLRPYFHKVGVAAINGVCSTDILVIVAKNPQFFGLVLSHISSDDLINYVDAASTGTKMPRTNWKDLASYDIVIPPQDLIEKFNTIIVPQIQKIRPNIQESRTLAAIRDALLPKLISGEIRVGCAEGAAVLSA